MSDEKSYQEAQQEMDLALQGGEELVRRAREPPVQEEEDEVFIHPSIVDQEVRKKVMMESYGNVSFYNEVAQLHLEALGRTNCYVCQGKGVRPRGTALCGECDRRSLETRSLLTLQGEVIDEVSKRHIRWLKCKLTAEKKSAKGRIQAIMFMRQRNKDRRKADEVRVGLAARPRPPFRLEETPMIRASGPRPSGSTSRRPPKAVSTPESS